MAEQIEAAIRVEPGVLALYAVQDKSDPTRVRVFEIYADELAYHAHLLPHFAKYKAAVQDIVRSLKLMETVPITVSAFDQMGPAEFLTDQGIDVRPHPHINLATVTFLFEGQILHRDSLGTEMAIEPGAVNWMRAGRGIVHSERTSPERKRSGQRLFGIQSWMALPEEQEETDPAFVHHGAEALPVVEGDGVRARVIAGEVLGTRSPLLTPSETVYAHFTLRRGARMVVEQSFDERALYTLKGEIGIAGDTFGPGQLLVLRPGDPIVVSAQSDAEFMLFGGAPMGGPRYIWWNFVSSRLERIEQAKEEWAQGRFDTVPGDVEEFIPLPEKKDTPLRATGSVFYP